MNELFEIIPALCVSCEVRTDLSSQAPSLAVTRKPSPAQESPAKTWNWREGTTQSGSQPIPWWDLQQQQVS